MHYVILGNGVAGMEAALALRRSDAGARISLVSDEHDHFYSRPALMYVFCGQLDLRGTEPYDRRFYERMRLERVRGRASALDTGRRGSWPARTAARWATTACCWRRDRAPGRVSGRAPKGRASMPS